MAVPRKQTRRDVLKQGAAIGAGFWVTGLAPAYAKPKSANDKLNIAVIGVMGQGQWNRGQLTEAGENIVALVDVDERWAGKAREEHPKATFDTDYRRVLDRKEIDAVLVATPDHSHALPAIMALKAGKHVYCEKPLCHTVGEVRALTDLAKETGLATQMGTQVHSRSNYRRVVELIRAKAIGEVREVHVWVDKQWAGGDVPTDTPPVPEGLHYDLWLGGAAERPYHPEYLPAKWRGWWDFGGGTLSDMACHHMDLPFWALDLKSPATIEAEGPEVHAQSTPKTLIVKYEFGARDDLPPVALTWYNGGVRPPYFSPTHPNRLPQWGSGTLFVGSEGMLLTDYEKNLLLPEPKFKDSLPPQPTIPDSIGHHKESIRWCKGGEPALCRFEYAGPLTEAVQLGNVSYRTGKKIYWDAEALKARGVPEADKFIHKDYRKGWNIRDL